MPSFSVARGVALALALSVMTGPSINAAPANAEPAPANSPLPIHGLPKILSVDLPANRDFYAGQTIRSSVVTTPNVAYVEARIRYRNAPLHRDGLGKFSLVYTIPWWLPPWLRHPWTVEFIARSVDGVEVREAFPIRVH